MTDEELITTLRGRNGFGWTEDAADRIEDLLKFSGYWHNRVETAEADRDRIAAEWAEVSQKNYQRAKTAEAKLAKTADALVKAKRYIEELEWLYAGPRIPEGDEYYAALAELREPE